MWKRTFRNGCGGSAHRATKKPRKPFCFSLAKPRLNVDVAAHRPYGGGGQRAKPRAVLDIVLGEVHPHRALCKTSRAKYRAQLADIRSANGLTPPQVQEDAAPFSFASQRGNDRDSSVGTTGGFHAMRCAGPGADGIIIQRETNAGDNDVALFNKCFVTDNQSWSSRSSQTGLFG